MKWLPLLWYISLPKKRKIPQHNEKIKFNFEAKIQTKHTNTKKKSLSDGDFREPFKTFKYVVIGKSFCNLRTN